jgi:hypothetical protein
MDSLPMRHRGRWQGRLPPVARCATRAASSPGRCRRGRRGRRVEAARRGQRAGLTSRGLAFRQRGIDPSGERSVFARRFLAAPTEPPGDSRCSDVGATGRVGIEAPSLIAARTASECCSNKLGRLTLHRPVHRSGGENENRRYGDQHHPYGRQTKLHNLPPRRVHVVFEGGSYRPRCDGSVTKQKHGVDPETNAYHGKGPYMGGLQEGWHQSSDSKRNRQRSQTGSPPGKLGALEGEIVLEVVHGGRSLDSPPHMSEPPDIDGFLTGACAQLGQHRRGRRTTRTCSSDPCGHG